MSELRQEFFHRLDMLWWATSGIDKFEHWELDAEEEGMLRRAINNISELHSKFEHEVRFSKEEA